KASLTRVCRAWNWMGQEVLYEDVWITKGRDARALAGRLLTRVISRRPSVDHSSSSPSNAGRYIRRLHVETLSMEKCSPHDLLLILQYAPNLEVYEDYKSVRRPMHPLALSVSPVVPFSLAGAGLSSTSTSSVVEGGIEFFEDVVGPRLAGVAGSRLEYLEGRFVGLSIGNSDSSSSIDGFAYTLSLPALLSLKVTLDDATFSVLSTWDMPTLTHLSVLSADFGYAGGGFRRFFEVHGEKIGQLELGHSSGDIEEAWLTAPPHPTNAPPRIPLNAWCPNLKEFICSADAEWNWQAPDWIAPHVLLPAHEGLVFIGVRGMERRLRGDGEEADDTYFMLLEQFGSLLRREAFPNLRRVRDMSWESDDAESRLHGARVRSFWRKVVSRCEEREVMLEDWRG
ncbi:hypothetical protein CPC08DRAFT_615557, partial [Agrocybe pediades]